MCLNESIQPLNMSKNETRKTYLRNIPFTRYTSESSRAPARGMNNAQEWKMHRSYWGGWGVSVKLHSNDLSAWLFGAHPEKKKRVTFCQTLKNWCTLGALYFLCPVWEHGTPTPDLLRHRELRVPLYYESSSSPSLLRMAVKLFFHDWKIMHKVAGYSVTSY